MDSLKIAVVLVLAFAVTTALTVVFAVTPTRTIDTGVSPMRLVDEGGLNAHLNDDKEGPSVAIPDKAVRRAQFWTFAYNLPKIVEQDQEIPGEFKYAIEHILFASNPKEGEDSVVLLVSETDGTGHKSAVALFFLFGSEGWRLFPQEYR